MKILKNAGTFEILNADTLKDQLLQIERAGRTCYQSERGEVTQESAAKFVRQILRRGHHSVIEHSSLVVKFDNVSRGFTHEMVRHRLASYSQESTRYVDYAKPEIAGNDAVDLDKFEIKCVAPPHRAECKPVHVKQEMVQDGEFPVFKAVSMSLKDMFQACEDNYRALRKAGWAPEDARQVLPIGLKSQIIVSANFREWRHIFSMRTTRYAHWEIRGVMMALLEAVQKAVPVIFDDFIRASINKHGLPYYTKEEKGGD